MDLNPIIRICLQTADGYYSFPWDATASINIMPGWGVGSVTHNGTIYALSAADTSIRLVLSNPTPIPDQWTALTLTPDDDITAAIAKRGSPAVLSLAAGDYRGQRVQMPADPAFSVDVGDAQDVEFYR